MGVLGVGCTIRYVTLNAKPEHGAAVHSLSPELSTVETSTTPGPLAALIVHAPIVAAPLIQMEVSDGLAIRVPRAALTGFTNALVDLT